MLLTNLQRDLITSLKAKNKDRVSIIRFLLSAINYKKIELQKELTDEDIYTVIRKLVKQHEESIEMFKKGNRDDLVKKEEDELQILKGYLPKEVENTEIEKVVVKIIDEVKSQLSEGQDMKSQTGRIIGLAVKELKGKAEGGKIAEIIKKIIVND